MRNRAPRVKFRALPTILATIAALHFGRGFAPAFPRKAHVGCRGRRVGSGLCVDSPSPKEEEHHSADGRKLNSLFHAAQLQQADQLAARGIR